MDTPDYITTFTCTKCGVEKPLTKEFFPPRKNLKTGFQGTCRVCERKRHKAYRRDNPDKVQEAVKRFREANPDYGKRWRAENPDYGKRYRTENADRVRENTKRWQQTNPDKAREKTKRWQQANPDKRKAMNHRQLARKHGLPDSFAVQDWFAVLEYFGHKCAVCGRPAGLWHTLAADHWIPLSSPNCPGTIPTNIVPLCHGDGGCNNSKNASDPNEWLIEKLGKRKAAQVRKRIETYFEIVIQREGERA